VIEDNADAREGLRGLLELYGHEVHEAADGTAGVQAALLLQPHAALIDIGLPGLDGYEVARQIRGSGLCDETLLIALTGYAQKEDCPQGEDAGFSHYLIKPVEPDKLIQLIADYSPAMSQAQPGSSATQSA
jgi:CheY-like chemotaxis protein